MAISTRRPPAAAPLPAGEVLILEEFLPYRLSVLASVVSQGFARLYSERFAINIPQWRVLAVLGQHGALTSREIGEQTHMHKTMLSRAVTDLERQGILARQRNEADKREAFLSLTGAGQRIYADIVPLARDYAARLTANLSGADRAALDHIMEMLRERSGVVFAAAGKPGG